MVEEVTTQHSICAVVVLYNDGQDSVPRVAGPKPTMLISICAVVVLYNDGQDSVPRVAGPKPTMLISIGAAMGGCVKILNSLLSQYIIIIIIIIIMIIIIIITSKPYHLINSIFCI